MKKVLFALLALGLLASVAGTILSGVKQGRREDTLEAFAAQLPSYMALWRDGVADESAVANGYLAGKAVIVEVTDREIDRLSFDLPDAIRATTPEEVGTLIFLKCRTPEVGSYTSGATARDHVCDMVAYDTGAGRVSAMDSVVRGAPGSISVDQSGTAGRPDEELLALIASLSGAE